jgi:DNA mismatch endonuclease (patch repair protein)
MGLRFRVNSTEIVGKPDIIFMGPKLAVFCDGDFWHGRHWRRLRQDLQRRHNADYWLPKILKNIQRDRHVTLALASEGWRVLRFWETDILGDPEKVAHSIRAEVLKRTTPRP